ncbi:MAG: hypothetical protein R2706_00795 [Acidimicrobiales bacterium]
MRRRKVGVRRLLTFSFVLAALATACGGAADPQIVDVAKGEETPNSLAFAVETTEPVADAASATPAEIALFACSDALVAYLAENPYETQDDILAIQDDLRSSDNPLQAACHDLDDLESLGLTEQDLTNHMLSQVPPDALPALLQLSSSFMS